ncbi:MAG: DUF4345 family protein [Pseudomonadota bacterium]
MLGKFILWLSTIAFVGYGIACLLSPDLPARNAGLVVSGGDGYAELGAMYGGLQTGFGLLCLLGAVRADFYRPVLTMLVVVIGLLALGRAYSMVMGPGGYGAYSYLALGYEVFTAVVAALALRSVKAVST